MRRFALVIGTVAIASLVAPMAAAAVTPTGKPPPVELEGKVNNEGTKTVKKGSISVEEDDFYFDATFLKSKPGRTIKVKLRNEGQASHTFTIDSLDIDKELAPGKKSTVEVEVPDTGSVAFYCRFHKTSGMQGAIFTKAGSTATPTGGGSSETPSTTSGGGGSPYGY